MIALRTTLLHGLLICLPFSVFAVVTFWKWPRLWLHSLPPNIARMAGPKTAAEERQTRYLLIPYLLILPGLSVASTLGAAWATGTNLTFGGALLHLYGVWIIVHVWDWLVIDGGHILIIDPQKPPVPGTAGAAGYKDFGFHWRALLRAVPLSGLFVVPVAGLLAVVA